MLARRRSAGRGRRVALRARAHRSVGGEGGGTGGGGGGASVGQPDSVAVLSSHAKCLSHGRFHRLGKKEGLTYPTPFSPGPWLKPGLKGGL
jgi:hypothetical protein